MDEPVGALEIGARLGVQPRTIHKWWTRGRMPAPDWEAVNGSRAWKWSRILRWAGETGRLTTDVLKDEYRGRFGKEPTTSEQVDYALQRRSA